MEPSELSASELQQQLAGPAGETVRAEVLADLAQLELRLAIEMAKMVPRSEYAAVAASLEAASVAQRVVRNWQTTRT